MNVNRIRPLVKMTVIVSMSGAHSCVTAVSTPQVTDVRPSLYQGLSPASCHLVWELRSWLALHVSHFVNINHLLCAFYKWFVP